MKITYYTSYIMLAAVTVTCAVYEYRTSRRNNKQAWDSFMEALGCAFVITMLIASIQYILKHA